MVIQNNLMALHAHGQMQINQMKLATSLQKLSSGYRINSAADDAAGLAMSERMRSQMTAMDRAMMNARDGQSLTSTAEGALTEVNTMLNRLTDLGMQASNGILNDSQRASIQKETDQILKEIDRISKATNFNGIRLLDGSLSGENNHQVQVGGVSVQQTAAVAGQYTYQGSDTPSYAGLKAGDSVSFTLGLNNGQSQTVNFTVGEDLQSLKNDAGQTFAFSGGLAGDGSVTVSGDTFNQALASSLQNTSLASSFSISSQSGALQLQNKEAGLKAPQIAGLSVKGPGDTKSNPIYGTVDAPANARADIQKESFQVFNGTNAQQATFSVNGKKFALVNEADYAATIAKNPDAAVNFIKVEGTSGASLTDKDLSVIAADINAKTGLALQTNGSDGIQLRSSANDNGLTLQVGVSADSYNMIQVSVGDMSTRGLGLEGLDFTSQKAAQQSLSKISAAQNKVSTTRGDLGASQNRLDHTLNNLGVMSENISAAESRIRNADMAKEMMNFMRQNVMNQASQAMLAQANAQTRQMLELLR